MKVVMQDKGEVGVIQQPKKRTFGDLDALDGKSHHFLKIILINYEDKDIKAYIESLICGLWTDVTTNRDWMKALDEKMDRSKVKFAGWFDDHDVEIDRLKERVEEQEKELDELRICLAGAEHLIESFPTWHMKVRFIVLCWLPGLTPTVSKQSFSPLANPLPPPPPQPPHPTNMPDEQMLANGLPADEEEIIEQPPALALALAGDMLPPPLPSTSQAVIPSVQLLPPTPNTSQEEANYTATTLLDVPASLQPSSLPRTRKSRSPSPAGELRRSPRLASPSLGQSSK